MKAAGRAVTLAELRGFVADLDAAGVADDTPVSGTVRVGGAVKSLKAASIERRRDQVRPGFRRGDGEP